MHDRDRRTFIKAGLAVGAAAVVESAASTLKALAALGGIERFVAKGNRVGLLVNAPPHWKLPGSHTRPEVVLALAKLCLDAGAKDVVTLPVLSSRLWTGSPLGATHAKVAKALKPCADRTVETKLPKGVRLKTGKVRPELLDVDVLINLPIAKHHVGTHFSGNLKNMMGGLDHETNWLFHTGSGKTDYEDVDFLSQCIADLNTLRKPDLCLVDATTVLGSNGPAGPGDLLKLDKVVAGTDPVAVDAYCVTLHNRKPAEVVMLAKAAAAGAGHDDLKKLKLQELSL
jgi:uncharacterized protein (DUF362 family)